MKQEIKKSQRKSENNHSLALIFMEKQAKKSRSL